MGSRANRGPKKTTTETGNEEDKREALNALNLGKPRPGRRRAMRMGSRANRGPKRTTTGTGNQEEKREALDALNRGKPRPGTSTQDQQQPRTRGKPRGHANRGP